MKTASRDRIEALQLKRLKATLSNAYANIPHYKAAFDAQRVHQRDLRHLSDLKHFPPNGLSAVPPNARHDLASRSRGGALAA